MADAVQTSKVRRRRRAGQDRARIIDAVCEVIAQRGWESARFADVANRAQVSISSLQYLFGSREDMIAVALEGRTQQFLDEARARAAEITDPVHRLRWIASCLASGTEPEDTAGLEWVIWTEYWRAALRDEDLRAVAVAAYHGWTALVVRAIEDCIDAGRIARPADLERISTGLVALGDGLGVQVSLGGTGLTWADAGALVCEWLAAVLSCPELVQSEHPR